jgi:hypothetical protein
VGVREWLYLVALGPVIGPRAAVVVVAMRIVQTLIELSLALVGAAALRSARASNTPRLEAGRQPAARD